MNDPEEFLLRLTPRGPELAVTASIQGAMTRELARPSGGLWERRMTWLTAAAVLFGIALNVLVDRADRQRQARWVRFDVLSPDAHEVAQMVASASDAETGAWVEQQFVQAHQRVRRPSLSPADFEHYFHLIMREPNYAGNQEAGQIRLPWPGHSHRHTADSECGPRLAIRQTTGSPAEQAARSGGAPLAA